MPKANSKDALRSLVVAIRKVRVAQLVGARVASVTLLKAMLDANRLNRPRSAQLLELATLARKMVAPVLEAAANAERVARELAAEERDAA